MPSVVRKIGHTFKSLFRRPRDTQQPSGHENVDHPQTPYGRRTSEFIPVTATVEHQPHNDVNAGYTEPQPSTSSSSRRVDPPPPPIRAATASGPSYLSNAHDFVIPNLTVNNSFADSKTVFAHLNPHIAHGAAHNSDERCDAPKCDPETRVAVQEEIMGWIRHGDRDTEPKKIMWLSGPAGAGKTAITGTIAESCKEEGLLAASFFFSSFSGSVDRRSKRCFVTTLAHHLAGHDTLHQFKAQLHNSIERHPDIFRKNLREQAEYLLVAPFRTIREQCDQWEWPKAIVVDGLDEVEAMQYHDPTRQQIQRTHEDDQVEILEVLFTLSLDPAFPFLILLASRPERAIAEFFATNARACTIELFLDSKYGPDADITRFLHSKFAGIRRRCGISGDSWPGENAVDRIVDMSSGQFIVPATIIRYVSAGIPQQQLKDVLQLGSVSIGAKNPFVVLDALYRHILKRSYNPDDDPNLVVKWIRCITSGIHSHNVPHNIAPPSAQFWRQFFEDVEGELNYRMGPITSLISVPPSHDTESGVTNYHKSLTDFLSSEPRCGDLFVTEACIQAFLGTRIVKVLKNKGPATPLSSPAADLFEFMAEFRTIRLFGKYHSVTSTETVLRREYAGFLRCLGEDSKAELAQCDAAWWTHLLLTGVVMGAREEESCQALPLSFELLGGIYCGIHRGVECGSDPSDSKCHPACIHWRQGILDQAKALGWCVHELEQVDADQLEHVTAMEFGQKFKLMGMQLDGSYAACAICQPMESSWYSLPYQPA